MASQSSSTNLHAGTCLQLRQSCDRCHEKKVKCVQPQDVSHKEASTCIRCRKTRALCVYSVPQRPGRPPATQVAIKGTSRTGSQDCADNDTMTLKDYTSTSQSVEDYSVGKTIRSSSIYTDIGQRSFKLSEVESFGELDMTFNTEHPLLQFQFNSIDVPEFQPPTPALRLDLQQFDSFETASAFTPLLSPCTSEDEGVRTTASDSIDAQIRDLAQLNLRVLQSSRDVEQDLATMQLSVSSPSFNGLFEATELFIGFCRRVSEFQLGQSPLNYLPTNYYYYTSQGELDGSSPIDSRSNKSPIDGRLYPDGSVLLMMLAFHHRLTSIFETICSSIYYHLLPTNNTWANPKNHDLISQDDSERYQHSWINQSMSSLPTGFNTNNSYNWSLASTAQIIMLVRLIRHLANRMNGVLRPFIEYPIESNNMPSQMFSTVSNNEYTSWPTLSEAPHSADLIEEDPFTTYLDMVNVNEKSRMFENPERNRSLNNSIELGRKMRDLGWLYSYIDRIESLVEQSDRV